MTGLRRRLWAVRPRFDLVLVLVLVLFAVSCWGEAPIASSAHTTTSKPPAKRHWVRTSKRHASHPHPHGPHPHPSSDHHHHPHPHPHLPGPNGHHHPY